MISDEQLRSRGVRRVSSEEKCARQIERAKLVYEQANRWIENADSKVSISMGVTTAVFGVFSYLSNNITRNSSATAPPPPPPPLLLEGYRLCTALSIICMGIAVVSSMLAIVPKLGTSGGCAKEKRFLLYFGDVGGVSLDTFLKKIEESSEGDVLREMAGEAHFNSKICATKMKKYRVASWFSLMAMVLAALGALLKFSICQ